MNSPILAIALRALAVWVVMAVVAIGNGVFRGAVLIPRLGETAGLTVSTLLLCALVFLLTWITIGWIGPGNAGRAVAVGVFWVALTVAFEFGFGHYVVHKPWATLLADYNLLKGRIWPLVLAVTAAAPYFAGRIRHLF